VSLGRARLALRRALPPGLVLLALALATLLVATTWRPGALEAQALAGAGDPAAAASALARQGLWTALLVLLAPFLVARAATTLPAWRRGEVDWLLASARSRMGLVASTYLGLLAAALLLVAFIAVAAELAAGPSGPGRALAARFETPALVVDAEEGLVRRVDPGFELPGGVLRVRLILVGGGRAADLRLAVRSAAVEGRTTAVRARLAGAGVLEVPLPAASGPYDLQLEQLEGEALVAVREDGLELVEPLGSARAAGLRTAARAILGLAALLALALGLGAWLSTPTALLGALALALAALLSEGPAARLFPLAALREALALAGEGLAAPWPSTRAVAAGALVAVLGLLLAGAGLRDWRRAA